MYLVLITFYSGDTEQSSYDSKSEALAHVAKNVDFVTAVEVKRVTG